MVEDPDVSEVASALHLSVSLLLWQLRQTRVEGSLSMPEATALRRLDRAGPTTVTALAHSERISVQSMGATLAALEKLGLIQRESDPDDGRRSVLSITPAGKSVLTDKHNARGEQLAQALSEGFSPAELRELMVAAPLIERLALRL
jgi:DNA-binding MarR family transcriptional regulator